MTKEYLKMADVFFKAIEPSDFSLKTASVSVYRDDGASPHEYAAHAINSHDELAAEVERLREQVKGLSEQSDDYKESSERWRSEAGYWQSIAEE